MNKVLKLIVITGLFSSGIFAQLNFEITDNVLLETKDGLSLEIPGDLIESGTGYLKGVVKSGQRISETSFAGFSISKGLDGSIRRITGESYAKGNGELQNFKRYYEIENSGGSEIITDMEIKCIISGNFDESNNLPQPYYIYAFSTEWAGYGDGNTTPPLTAVNVIIPVGTSDWIISDNAGMVSVKDISLIPDKYELYQNYPNPFNPCTTIKYSLPFNRKGKTINVKLIVYDVLGREIAILVNEEQYPGKYEVKFNASNFASGVYFYKIRTVDFTETRKMLICK